MKNNKRQICLTIATIAALVAGVGTGRAATGLDTSFGTGGKKIMPVVVTTGTSFAQAVLVEPGTGKILAGGGGRLATANVNGFALTRLLPDGNVDTLFNGVGSNIIQFSSGGTPFDSNVSSLGIQTATGKYVAAGNILNGSVFLGAVIRLNTDGTLDSNFGNGGSFVSQFGSSTAFVTSMAVLPDGSMYLAGYVGASGAGRNFLLAKLTPNGALDTAFGTGGIATVDFNNNSDQANSIVVSPATNAITIAGASTGFGASCALARFTSSGVLDTTFGTGGKVFTDVVVNNADYINKIVLDPSGGITAVGVQAPVGFERHLLLRYTSNGLLNPSFGANGIAGAYFGNNQELLKDVVELPNGKLFVSGYVAGGIGLKMSVSRYNADGTIDRSFICGGEGITTFGASSSSYGFASAMESNGNIIVVGQGTSDAFPQNSFSFASFLDPATPTQCAVGDSDRDGISDVYVERPDNDGMGHSVWYRLFSSGSLNPQFTNLLNARAWGLSTDVRAPADYDGDGRTDDTVYRDGVWWIYQSSTGQARSVTFGQTGDLPRPGDFDGDGKGDICVFRPSAGTWYCQRSSDGQIVGVQFGQDGDVPMIGDYDGDGKADLAVFRPSTGVWYITRSSDGQMASAAFGQTGDIPLSGDFNGDGKSDVAVYRPSDGTWYVARPTGVPAQNFDATPFGISTDVPVPGDYDGDGKTDIAIYRNGDWWILHSSSGTISTLPFGLGSDKPVESAYMP